MKTAEINRANVQFELLKDNTEERISTDTGCGKKEKPPPITVRLTEYV